MQDQGEVILSGNGSLSGVVTEAVNDLDVTGKTEHLSSNERSLKDVMKETDYHKVETIIEMIDQRGNITPAEARKACGKSDVTFHSRRIFRSGYSNSERNGV